MTPEEIKHAFTYHPPSKQQAETYDQLRAAYRNLALLVNQIVPPPVNGKTDERQLALEHLRASLMWANAGIALNTLLNAPVVNPPDPTAGMVMIGLASDAQDEAELDNTLYVRGEHEGKQVPVPYKRFRAPKPSPKEDTAYRDFLEERYGDG